MSRKLYTSYRDQKRRCEDPLCKEFVWYGAKGVKVEYSFDELQQWFLSQPAVDDWSIGRMDHSKNYSLNNIELVSRMENRKEGVRRNGTPKPRVPVDVYRDGLLIGSYPSQVHAAMAVGGTQGSVLNVISGRRKTHKGCVFVVRG